MTQFTPSRIQRNNIAQDLARSLNGLITKQQTVGPLSVFCGLNLGCSIPGEERQQIRVNISALRELEITPGDHLPHGKITHQHKADITF